MTLVVLVLSPLLVILSVYAVLVHLLKGVLLYIAIWCCWCLCGRDVLFVYSDSPIWRGYIEEHILSRLKRRAIVLNWSDRKKWRPSLAVFAFRYFGGDRAFNPMAIVFRPLRVARQFRFYEAFRDFKHGNTQALIKLERELFELLDRVDKR